MSLQFPFIPSSIPSHFAPPTHLLCCISYSHLSAPLRSAKQHAMFYPQPCPASFLLPSFNSGHVCLCYALFQIKAVPEHFSSLSTVSYNDLVPISISLTFQPGLFIRDERQNLNFCVQTSTSYSG